MLSRTSPSVHSSIMIQTGFSVIIPISFTMCGWSNCLIVTVKYNKHIIVVCFRSLHLLISNFKYKLFHSFARSLSKWFLMCFYTHRPPAETSHVRCQMCSFYTSLWPRKEMDSPARQKIFNTLGRGRLHKRCCSFSSIMICGSYRTDVDPLVDVSKLSLADTPAQLDPVSLDFIVLSYEQNTQVISHHTRVNIRWVTLIIMLVVLHVTAAEQHATNTSTLLHHSI